MAYFAAADTVLASLEARVAALEALSGPDYYDAVTDGGCDNTGESDCVSDILAAVTAYKAAGKDGLYFPAGTYLLSSTLTVPDGTTFVGSGMTTAWLKGPVVFDSNQDFTDLKIGPDAVDVGPSIANADGSIGTSFTRCRFRGGGTAGTPTSPWRPNVYLGYGKDLASLTFTDCEIERTLGTGYVNTVSLYAANNTVDGVTFDGCHFGVTNGTATGSGAIMCECWTAQSLNDSWANLTFTGCEFEPSGIHCLDFACYTTSGRGTGVLVEDCLFHGAGTNGTGYGYGIALEWPDDVTITGNTFYVCTDGAIVPGANVMGDNADTYWEFSDNVFDYDTAEGSLEAVFAPVSISSNYNTITGNTFNCAYDISWYGLAPMVLWWGGPLGANLTGNVLTGNTFNLNATCPATRAVNSALESNQTVSNNTVNRS